MVGTYIWQSGQLGWPSAAASLGPDRRPQTPHFPRHHLTPDFSTRRWKAKAETNGRDVGGNQAAPAPNEACYSARGAASRLARAA